MNYIENSKEKSIQVKMAVDLSRKFLVFANDVKNVDIQNWSNACVMKTKAFSQYKLRCLFFFIFSVFCDCLIMA